MSGMIPPDLSIAATAHWAAAARAQESARPDGLFNDPWAAALAGEEGARWLESLKGSAFGTVPMVIRTRFFDEYLVPAAWDGGLRQVVILAAGLDTRAYRLAWPAGLFLFEVDRPTVLEYKEYMLARAGARPACRRIPVSADLTGDWDALLTACGFDAARPTAWLLEGVLFYLAPAAVAHLLTTVSRLSARGSRLGFDIVNGETLTTPITRNWIEMQARLGAPWTGWLDDPRGFLAALGWQVAVTQPGAPDASYGRWTLPVIPVEAPGLPHNWYITSVKGN